MSLAQLMTWILILLIRQAIRSGFAKWMATALIFAWLLV